MRRADGATPRGCVREQFLLEKCDWRAVSAARAFVLNPSPAGGALPR
jgi:hypothetical protein